MKTSSIIRNNVFLALFLISSIIQAQTSTSETNKEFYVVVGAFKIEKNAINFTSSLVDQGFEAIYKLNNDQQLNYVYTYKSESLQQAKERVFTIRDKYPEMSDSWLYYGNLTENNSTAVSKSEMVLKTKEPIAVKTTSEPDLVGEEENNNSETIEDSTNQEVESEETNIVGSEEQDDIASTNMENVQEEEVVQEPLEAGAFRIYLNTVKATNQHEISADFKVIDLEREKQLSPIKSHEEVIIKPKNGTNRIKLVSNIFGYKIEELVVDLDEPLIDTDSRVEVKDNTIFIDFELSKYKKGEFAVLWQVFFYRDAAIMKEESVYELNQLLGMMRDDEKMRIKIHGHTNGNSHGKVLHLDLDDKQFFSLNGSHNEDIASAKKLSEYRAYTIQHWLIDQGIAEDRMEIVGWGGKKMLQDKHDDKAHQNVRVEIEVLETS